MLASSHTFTPNPCSGLAVNLVKRINTLRNNHGSRSLLAICPVLCGVSQAWSARMASMRSLVHGNPVYRLEAAGIRHVASGECIAMTPGSTPDVDAAFLLWANDGPHRLVLLGGYDRVGVGRTVGMDGNNYWCLDLAGTLAKGRD